MAAGIYHESPFERIVEVGWGGGVAIVEIHRLETKGVDVFPSNPSGEFFSEFSGALITPDDYRQEFGLYTESFNETIGIIGTVVSRDEITDQWIWDGYYIGALGDDAINLPFVALGDAEFGYAANIHLTGQQAQLNPPIGGGSGPYTLGETVTHLHPDGFLQEYKNGYVALTHGPVYDGLGHPSGDVSYAGTESWYWYRIGTIAEQTKNILRSSFLANMRSGFTIEGEIFDNPDQYGLVHDLEWSIKLYRGRPSFSFADGVLTPTAGQTPFATAEGTVAFDHTGTIKRFTRRGFV